MNGLRAVASWRAALRIARREVRRSRGRAALVIAMIALPVFGLTFAAVTFDMFDLTPEEEALRELGAADAMVFWTHDGPVAQSLEGDGWRSSPVDSATAGPRSGADLVRRLPPGSRATVWAEGRAEVPTPDGMATFGITEVDAGDPLVAGVVRVVEGAAPSGPDEVALTERAADQMQTRVGGTVRLAEDAPGRRVVAIVELSDALGPALVFPPGQVPAEMRKTQTFSSGWLVDTPGIVDIAQVERLNHEGIVVRSRAMMLDPAANASLFPPSVTYGAGDLALGGLILGLGVLEVVLLAGPAFAVGARRRTRDLALVAANGGTAAHLRRIVLADGVVLGIAGAACGIVLGIGTAFAARPILEVYLFESRAGGYRVFPLALLAIAALAVITGLLAALVPAFVAARQDVVAALSGRRGTGRPLRRWWVLGVAMVGLGAGVAVYGAYTVRSNLVLGALVLGQLGLVFCTPALVGLLARLGSRLPLPVRIALRDTARNRAAAAPAISAVMAAVAGSAALGIFLESSSAEQAARYRPSVPLGSVTVQYFEPPAERSAATAPGARTRTERIRAAIADILPMTGVYDVGTVGCADQGPTAVCALEVVRPASAQCPYWNHPGPMSREVQLRARADRRCAGDAEIRGSAFGTTVDDGTALAALTGASDTDIRAATAVLRAGGVVVTDELAVVDGRATLRGYAYLDQPPGRRELPEVTVPAYVLRTGIPGGGPVISPDAVRRAGQTIAPAGLVVATSRMPTNAEEEAVRAAVGRVSSQVGAVVERGDQSDNDPVLVVLAIAAGLITVGAAGIATGLAAAEGRADLSTLASVGASPRLRRTLSLSQSGVIAGLGALLGLVAGVGVSVAVLYAVNRAYVDSWPAPPPYPITVPWHTIAALVVVPLIAMLGAGLLTRSRLPIEARRPD